VIADQLKAGIALEAEILHAQGIFLRDDGLDDVYFCLLCIVGGTWRFLKLLIRAFGSEAGLAYVNTTDTCNSTLMSGTVQLLCQFQPIDPSYMRLR
jgi:hypothetical protein